MTDAGLKQLQLAPPSPGLMAFRWEHGADGGQSFPWVGAGCLDLLGLEPAALMADPGLFWQLVHPDDRAPLKRAQLNAQACGGLLHHICRITTPAGEARLLEIVASPTPPFPTLWTAFALEISEQKRRLDELMQLHQVHRQEREQAQQQLQDQARSLAEAHAALVRLTTLDAATGLPNRLHFEHSLMRAASLAQRHGRPLLLLQLKLRGLRLTNARHGFLAGDQVLQAFGRLLLNNLRQGDMAGRLGGVEFAVLLPECDRAGADQLVAALQLAMASSEAFHGPGLSLDHGLAECLVDDTADQLLLRAEAALREGFSR